MLEPDHLEEPSAEMTSARLLLIGRLVASIVHEVSNPMQAIRGALVLAGEEIDDRESVQAYINLCLQETERVIHLTTLLRQIYRPESNRPRQLDLNQVLNDALRLARDEMNRQGVEVIQAPGPGPLDVKGSDHQLELALVYLLLHLAGAAGAARVRRIHITTGRVGEHCSISITVPLAPGDTPLVSKTVPGLGPYYTIVEAHQGSVQLQPQAEQQRIQIEFPYQAA